MKKDFSKVSSHRAGSPPELMCVLLLVTCIGEIFVDEALIKQFSIFSVAKKVKTLRTVFGLKALLECVGRSSSTD